MRPYPEDTTIEIPLTFDVTSSAVPLTERRVFVGLLILVGIVLGGIVLAIVLKSLAGVILSIALVATSTTLFRFLYFRELYYKKKYAELETKGYVYKSNAIWSIYEIAPGVPICSFKNGTKAVFVSFDKDIIVGKPENNNYLHYEAIADAYNRISQKSIEVMHIDYMDTVGKDGRLNGVLKNLLETPNPELRQLLSLIFEYQQYTMSKSYATYDVFAFYFKYSDEEFKDDLEMIIGSFMQANYIRYRLLGSGQLRELVKSIFNLPEFSVNEACDNVFKSEGTSKFIRVIYTERDGIKTVINKTTAEKEQEKEKTISETRRKPTNTIRRKPQPIIEEQEEVDIFEEYEQEVEEEYYTNDTSDDFVYLDEDDIVSDFTGGQTANNGVFEYSEEDSDEIDLFGDSDDDEVDLFG